MGRPREHDESTRRALLDAAEQLLTRGEGLSVRALADATSTTTRAIYSVFGNMDGVYRALLGRAFDEIRERVEAIPTTNDPQRDVVNACVDGFRMFAVTHPNLFRVAFERMVPGAATADAIPEATRAIRVLGERVHRCKQAGLLGGRSTREVTWQCHALCQGLASLEMQGWLGAEPERQWREAMTALVVGLATPPPTTRKVRSGSGRSGASR